VKDNLELIKFRKSLIVTIVITYLLIMVGALVRSTGSGMGCPDWPKCFGQYIPPTNISQLPTNYKEIFKVEGKTIADFNAFHTWVEYLNRLLGVVVGFVILAMVYFAFPIRKTHRKVWLSTLFSLFLVLFIGWVGSKVVSSNLAPIKISIHMILALALSFVLVGTYYLTSNITAIEKIKEINAKPFFNYYLALFLTTVVQIFVGTQVRQQVDEISMKLQNTHREHWIENLDFTFEIHKFFAGFILFSFIGIFYYYRKKVTPQLQSLITQNTILVVIEFLLGDILNFFMPAFAQPIHLLMANLMAGSLFYTLIVLNKARADIE